MIRMVVIDVETSGPYRVFNGIVPYHNLLEIGAVEVLLDFDKSKILRKFYAILKPLSDRYDPKSIVHTSGKSLEYYKEKGEDPKAVMEKFYDFLYDIFEANRRKVHFASDNPDFDAGWVRLYFDIFGIDIRGIIHHNSVSIKDLVRGFLRNFYISLYRLPGELKVNLPHTHNALDDATRNAHVLINLAKFINF